MGTRDQRLLKLLVTTGEICSGLERGQKVSLGLGKGQWTEWGVRNSNVRVKYISCLFHRVSIHIVEE